ncbi:MAG: heme lyase CcmF/NrfE family subunit [Alphaproteobacteria bacterium]
MSAEIGLFALILAFLLSLVQAAVPLAGAARNDGALMGVARPAAIGQFALILIAFLCLGYAFATSDFTVKTVVENSHSAKPLIYKITGTWGNHEGSMVLWVLILALFGASMALFGGNIPRALLTRTLAVQGIVGAAFLGFILFTSNPFARVLPPPADGQGLNPLLQDPGLIIHPPFLYLGYVGFSIVFSFAVAGLLMGKVDQAWARWVRPWAVAAWSFLTVGIALGSWWAYYELGWGGWWAWDPVENASFMPWLIGTALLHSVIVLEKRGTLKSWTVLLAILAFGFSLIGTFLVRSGILTSVHAFAVDPERGVFILVILAAAIGGSLALFAMRAPTLTPGGTFRPVSREGAILLNNLFMVCGCAVVFLGTFYPLFVDAMTGGKISVGPPYFNLTFVPLMVPMLIALGVAPLLPWKSADLAAVAQRIKWAFFLTVAASLIAVWMLWGAGLALSAAGVGLAVWVTAGTLTDVAERTKLFRVPLRQSWSRAAGMRGSVWGMAVAHLGMGLLVLAITGVSAWKQERVLTMQPGQTIEFAGYQVKLLDVTMDRGPNYTTQRAAFAYGKDAPVKKVAAERRFYPVREMQTTEAGIRTSLTGDLYLTVGDRHGDRGWAVHVYSYPLAPFLWISAAIMVLGGAIAVTDRQAAVRRRDAAHATAAAGSAAPQTAG